MISDASIAVLKNQVDWSAWDVNCDSVLESTAGPWLVLCSGGADSVFLACALKIKFGEIFSQFQLVHFNHGLRGSESDGDEEFCRTLAEKLNFPFISKRFESVSPSASENDLRNLRLKAIERLLEGTGAKGVLLGHHATDAVEWGLMSIFRGAGPRSLGSPAPVKKRTNGSVFLRPLMGYSRAEIRTFLERAKIPWREDSSNEKGDFTRNRLRREVITKLREAIPHPLEKGYSRTQILMTEADAAVEYLLTQAHLDFSDGGSLDATSLSGKPIAVWRRAYFNWVNVYHPALTFLESRRLDLILQAWSNGDKFQTEFKNEAGKIVQLICENHHISVGEQWDETAKWWGSYRIIAIGNYYFPSGELLKTESVQGQELKDFKKNPRQVDQQTCAWVDFEALMQPLSFSNWVPGDRFYPLGAPGAKKVQDWFVDRKIPEKWRNQLPVCKDGTGEIVWIPGFPPANKFIVTSLTAKALRLTYRLL